MRPASVVSLHLYSGQRQASVPLALRLLASSQNALEEVSSPERLMCTKVYGAWYAVSKKKGYPVQERAGRVLQPVLVTAAQSYQMAVCSFLAV